MKENQKVRIIKYLKKHKAITQLEAIRDLGIFRLASRIAELKNDGILIQKKSIKVKNRYGECTTITEYSLKNEKPVRALTNQKQT